MDITNMLNNKGSASAAAAGQHFQHHLAQVNTNIPSSINTTGYPSPHEMQPPMSMLGSNYGERAFDHFYIPKQHPDGNHQSRVSIDSTALPSPKENGTVRTFPCATCGKGFARRSDLARHERIHSGDRPHVCPEKGCGKPFIQRSALTVHMRVHSGEKPHMCERCGKPFSDSSSLARHRRIHSGKRPYKCPFADCQKTFTRRTTLTRHQNHHTGTVEEAAAATARVLASRGPGSHQRADSDSGAYSDTASNLSINTSMNSPSDRPLSLSPGSEIPTMPNLNRQTSNLSYNSNDSLPPHMRAGLQQPSPRSSPSASSPSLSAFGTNGGTNHYHRQSLTSHPTLPVLEPPTYHELRQPGSGSGSPHLSQPSSAGWQSPAHPNMPSPIYGETAMYSDSSYGGVPNMHLYYPNSNLRRPQSTEPDHYELRPRLSNGNSGALWAS